MKIPELIIQDLNKSAMKFARFNWFHGWEKSSGYIKSRLDDDAGYRYGSVPIWIEWKKKTAPTDEQIKNEIEKCIQRYLNNEEHHQNQKEFAHYVQNKYFFDIKRLKHEVEVQLVDNLSHVIKAIEGYSDFELPCIQQLHNDLKNLECGIDNAKAIEEFLALGRNRVGET